MLVQTLLLLTFLVTFYILTFLPHCQAHFLVRLKDSILASE